VREVAVEPGGELLPAPVGVPSQELDAHERFGFAVALLQSQAFGEDACDPRVGRARTAGFVDDGVGSRVVAVGRLRVGDEPREVAGELRVPELAPAHDDARGVVAGQLVASLVRDVVVTVAGER